jgi:response regulator of citrate/malate metabolism
LEDIERKIEKVKAQRAEERKSSKRLKTKQSKRLQEIDDDILANREREMRVKQTKLIIGGSHDSKLEWIKIQSFDLNRTIQDIANDLGESMIAVRKYLDEIANRDVV